MHFVCMHACMHACIYTRTHACTHTHTHTHKHTQSHTHNHNHNHTHHGGSELDEREEEGLGFRDQGLGSHTPTRLASSTSARMRVQVTKKKRESWAVWYATRRRLAREIWTLEVNATIACTCPGH